MSRIRSALLALPVVAAALAAAPAAAQYDNGGYGPGGAYGPPAGPPPVNGGPYYGRAPFTGLRVEGLAGYDRLSNDGHSSDVMYGVAAGYDMQFRRAIVGIEGEVNDSNIKECFDTRDFRYCAKAGRDFYVGGRAGFALSPAAMIYAKAGYTNARIKVTADDGFDRFTLGHQDLDGVRLGAGVEYNLFANTYAKAEYRYSNYERGYDRNQVVGGFGVRF